MTIEQVWGEMYQTENDPEKMKAFQEHSLDIPLQLEVAEGLDAALSAFQGDKGIDDLSYLREILIATAKHESLGGKLLEQEGGPARGAWQVEPETARSILDTAELIGPNAEKAMGVTASQLRVMDDHSLGEALKDHKVGAAFAAAKYLQAADSRGMLDQLQPEPTPGIVAQGMGVAP